MVFEYIAIIIGIAPMALMVNWVLLPHAFVGGGLTGICSAIYYVTDGLFPSLFPEYHGAIPVWLTTFVINVILLIIAGFTVGWRFCIRTMVGVAAITFWYRVIPILPQPIIDDPWLGAIIAAVIIKSGIGMLAETLSKILGERADAQLARDIKGTILTYPQISGAYDLILHNYGPDSYNGSVHIEVPDTLSADDLDKLIRKVTVDVYHKHDVILTAIGVYSFNTKDPEAAAAREKVRQLVMDHPYVLQMHGFYLDQAEKLLRFDFVVSFDAPDRRQVYQEISETVQKAFPEYTLQIAMDTDFTEEE